MILSNITYYLIIYYIIYYILYILYNIYIYIYIYKIYYTIISRDCISIITLSDYYLFGFKFKTILNKGSFILAVICKNWPILVYPPLIRLWLINSYRFWHKLIDYSYQYKWFFRIIARFSVIVKRTIRISQSAENFW